MATSGMPASPSDETSPPLSANCTSREDPESEKSEPSSVAASSESASGASVDSAAGGHAGGRGTRKISAADAAAGSADVVFAVLAGWGSANRAPMVRAV